MSMYMKLISLFSVLALFYGCVPPPRPVPTHYNFSNPIKRVAILPMKNDTVDVNGPDMVRSKMEAALKERGYNVKPLKESDQILRDQMGINLGGQLDLTTPQKLGEALGVEGVLYGNLMDFDETTTGLYNVKKVRAKFKLVNAMTGSTFWERGLGVKSEVKMSGALGTAATVVANVQDARDKETPWEILDVRTSNKGFGETVGIELGTKLLSKAMGTHLDRESTELATRITRDLPWGPGPGR